MPSKVDQRTIDKWVMNEMPKCPSWIQERLGRSTVKNRISKEVENNLERCFDDTFVKRIYNYCKIVGSKTSDYNYRRLTTPLGEIITSIRFIGGDLNKPAVYLVYKEFDLDSLKNIQTIGQLMAKEYALFNPQRIFWNSTKIERDLISTNNEITGDMVSITHFIDHLRNLGKPDNFEVIQFIKASSLNWYSTYKNAFEELRVKWPAFIEMGVPTTETTFKDLMKKELVFEILIDGKWAGIIAANNGSNNFLSGFYIEEEFLLEQFRGKHLASAVQRHLIENLPSDNNAMLSGTIHYENIPSLKTAMSVGRKPIGMDVFAKI